MPLNSGLFHVEHTHCIFWHDKYVEGLPSVVVIVFFVDGSHQKPS